MNWQPISTAPMDAEFLVRNAERDEWAVVFNSESFRLIPVGVEAREGYDDVYLRFEPFEWRFIE